MKRYERGSEWRRWDLHVHTPDSILENKFNGDWEGYISSIESKGDFVSVIGITDYFTISGYKRIVDYKKSGRLVNIAKIFPNIEFRVSPETTKDKGVNIHLIVDSEDEDHISRIESALARLTINYDGQDYPCTESGLRHYGKKINSELSDEAALREGVNQFKPSFEKFKDWVNGDKWLKENSLIAVANASKDGASGIRDNGFHAVRKDIYFFTDFVFSSQPNDIKHFMGGDGRSLDSVISDYKKIIPCIHGSDAHCIDKIFKPDLNRYCWIKADPTFDGLRQVLCEPERVKIQELKPGSKPSYHVIKKVRYIDDSGKRLFNSDWINLNEDLNTIIGGKSSGKSMLLYHMAKAINSKEVQHNVNTSNSSTYDDLNGIGFEVEWGDGERSVLHDGKDISEHEYPDKAITYIPQLYINKLADDDGKDDLNNLVSNVLLQNDAHREVVDKSRNEISDVRKRIGSLIERRFELLDHLSEINVKIGEIGNEESICKEIARLEEEFRCISLNAKLTEADSELHKKISKRIESLSNLSDQVYLISKNLSFLERAVEEDKSSLVEGVLSQLHLKSNFSDSSSVLASLNGELASDIEWSLSKYLDAIKKKKIKASVVIEKLEKKLISLRNEINPLEIKMGEVSELAGLRDLIEKEKDKLVLIKDNKKRKFNIASSNVKCNEELYENFEKMVSCYYRICESIDMQKVDEDLLVSADVSINEERFYSFIDSFNRRKSLDVLLGDLIVDGELDLKDMNFIGDKVRYVASKIESSEAPSLKKNVSYKDAFKRLFDDYFEINYKVTYKNDDIFKMSPGKRGLVLLNLMFELSNASYPILIDQPEDNLDNRTIYSELKEFVKRCKKKRQIIMVTHNSNLVVSADAECVVVANQRDKVVDVEDNLHKFEYITGSLELSYGENLVDNYHRLSDLGIRQHVCHILEGGVQAFKERERKYNIA